MRTNHVKIIALAFALQIVFPDASRQAVAQAGRAAYPARASLDQYLISDEKAEIALARSAAPSSISDGAEVRFKSQGADREYTCCRYCIAR
jgi:hypothetical protein